MTINWRRHGFLMVSVAMGLTACSGNSTKEPASAAIMGKAENRFEARSDCGNDPSYTIDGKSYKVLDSAAGYSEKGTAAWYGAEYQGTETAGCEVFDMYTYSAAHRTLPIPTFARVTNEQNGKNIIVRINDRGPFDSGDLIQLSFAAANALGIKSHTGAPVSVEALSPDQFEGKLAPGMLAGGNAQAKPGSSSVTTDALERKKQQIQPVDKSKVYYVVAGTWPDKNPALDMFMRLSSAGLGKTEMAAAREKGRDVYQVRVGPLYNQDQIDNVKDTMSGNGLANFRVVAQ
ncbi:MAG: septal ring lytic transglycosylase RlpA family protein [Gammaproteobacteria bacterium]|nr:septal ring lytic transglycosylase RlpA family protein [Gammaproteobacteria bacterium]MBU1725876.1 septal ring lytic transglycosylase RlpA family protein [Gammaproteobacteria bacterium]MBU2006000.1 septal ring lytic transglycosylase RlpA family protein [Gammaproteobacteria bacterium]